MSNNEGIPLHGDRAAWNVVDHPTEHAKDISDNLLTRHLPAPSTDGNFVRDDGSHWQAQHGIDLADINSYMRGAIICGGATDWEVLDAKTSGAVLIGDGTDVVSRVLVEADITDLEHNAVKIQSRDVAATAPSDNQALIWDETATQWEPGTVSLPGHTHTEADVTDLEHDAVKLQGRDIATTAPTDGQALVWDEAASQWEPGTVSTGEGGSGTASGVITDPVFKQLGTLAVTTSIDGAYVAPRAATINAVYIYCANTGSSGSTIVDVNINGTTIFTTQANRPQLAYDDTDGVAKSGTPDVTSVSENDVITVDIDQVATGAEDLVVVVGMSFDAPTLDILQIQVFN